MSKLILLCLIIWVSSTNLFADITEKQVEKYMDFSLGGVILNHHHQQLYNKFVTNDIGDLKKFEKIIDDSKHIFEYVSVFKNLDEIDYYKIKAFYNSDIGKKYIAGRTRVLNYKNRDEIKSEFKKLTISKEKRILIDSITKALNLIELKMNYASVYFKIYNEGLPENMQESNEQIEKKIKTYKSKLEQYHRLFSELTYKNFTKEELEQVLIYAKTQEAKNEIKLIYNAATKYMKSIMVEIMKELKIEINQKK